jgi:hypothetical protein
MYYGQTSSVTCALRFSQCLLLTLQSFGNLMLLSSVFYPEDGGSKFLRNVGAFQKAAVSSTLFCNFRRMYHKTRPWHAL